LTRTFSRGELPDARFASRPFNDCDRASFDWMRRDRPAAARYFLNDRATIY
jgi:hypothetical protein